MPTNFDDPAVWEKLYRPVAPRVEPWASDWEWIQDDGSWGDAEPPDDGRTRKRRAKRVAGYSRAWAINYYGFDNDLQWHKRIRDHILANVPAPGMQTTDRILVAGAALGFLVEVFRDAGYVETYGLEPSAYCQGKKVTETAPGVILVDAEWSVGPAIRNALRNATGHRYFDWIIDDEILLGYNDAEIVTDMGAGLTIVTVPTEVLDAAHGHERIVHLVRTGSSVDPEVIPRPDLATWQALAPSHTWLDTGAI